jgi:hypothetical protein
LALASPLTRQSPLPGFVETRISDSFLWLDGQGNLSRLGGPYWADGQLISVMPVVMIGSPAD